MKDDLNQPDEDNEAIGFNNQGIQIIEIGENEGVVDRTIRPLRESLRKLIQPNGMPSSSGDETPPRKLAQ